MYVYDRANALAQDIKQSPEYKEYKALKDELYENATTKDLLKQYKKLQFEAQTQYMSGQQPSAELMDKIKKLNDVLVFNPKVNEFFIAEYKFNTLISDVYKIIGDACDIDTDFMKD
ncbi:MAG: YlbF family regulator [Clostridiales bacterium]|nr:YlbF family regulator [Clostridiales bacterium]MBR3843169.1 YlbF family regulator [Christensenellaceae bacterium]